jgi:type I restriction enzyme S subunit
MKSTYDTLGKHIRPIDVRNSEGKEENLLGVTTQKYFMPSIANTVGTDFSKYKVVRKGQFTYVPDTSRRGDRIAIALLQDWDEGLVSNIYTVFEVTDTEKLMPEYLMLWFKRPEFDRYARFKSHGSVREIFDWDELCKVKLPVPDIEVQRSIVRAYNTIEGRIKHLRELNDNLLATLQASYRERFTLNGVDDLPAGWTLCQLGELCSKIGSGATPTGGKAGYLSTGISLIRSTNVFDYYFSYGDLAHISDEQAKALNNVTVQEYDILINITGVSVARCCIVPSNVLPARVNQHVMIIRPVDGESMSYYLLCVLCSNENKLKLLGIGQSGSTREAINQQELRSFIVVKPPESVIKEFGKVAAPIYRFIADNMVEILNLSDLQYVLLSKLSA